MRKLFTTAFAALMAASSVGATAVTASAAPVVPLVQTGDNANNVVQVQDRVIRRYNRNGRLPPLRHEYRRDYRPAGVYYRGGNGWYNGHRGYRSYRPGYRRYNDWWFPAGAFVAGAVIGGALSQPTYVERPRVIYRSANYSNAHVRWCYDRYRSYRAYDNTFQPYNGPRQQCWSPYS